LRGTEAKNRGQICCSLSENNVEGKKRQKKGCLKCKRRPLRRQKSGRKDGGSGVEEKIAKKDFERNPKVAKGVRRNGNIRGCGEPDPCKK